MGSLHLFVPYIGVRYIGMFLSYGFVTPVCSLHRGSLYRDIPYTGVRYTCWFLTQGFVISGLHCTPYSSSLRICIFCCLSFTEDQMALTSFWLLTLMSSALGLTQATNALPKGKSTPNYAENT